MQSPTNRKALTESLRFRVSLEELEQCLYDDLDRHDRLGPVLTAVAIAERLEAILWSLHEAQGNLEVTGRPHQSLWSHACDCEDHRS